MNQFKDIEIALINDIDTEAFDTLLDDNSDWYTTSENHARLVQYDNLHYSLNDLKA